MKMKRKVLFVGLMALLAASGVTAFLYYLVADRLIEPTVVEASTQQPVIVAARGIARGVRLDESDLFIETRDVEQIPPGAYDSIDRLTGKLVVQPVAEGELLLPGHFPATGNGGLSSAIPPGMRAVSLHVEEYAGVTQIVEVGDRVDVHVASGRLSPGRGEITLRTLSQSLEVLSTGREFAEDRRKAIPVVTVLVASEHAEQLALADQAGAIRLSLRNPVDDEAVKTPAGGTQAGSVVAGSRASSRPRGRTKPKPAPEPEAEKAAVRKRVRASQDAQVLITLKFAGLGDEALSLMTARLVRRTQKAPLIISSFEAGWDAQSLLGALEVKQNVEVFDAPSYLTLNATEAQFEKASFAPLKPELTGGVDADLDRVGVKVNLSPRITESGRIRMKVRAEVIIPDGTHTVRIGSTDLPRVTVRRSESELELADGQSFWIRGLIDRPGAWDFLRRLFPERPLERDRNDELVIVVTPTIVDLSAPDALAQLND